MRALGVVWGWWAWRGWVVGGTLRPSSSPSIFHVKEFGVPPFQVLLQARFCALFQMRSVGPDKSPFPRLWFSISVGLANHGVSYGHCGSGSGRLPPWGTFPALVCMRPPVLTRQDPPLTVQVGILRSGNLPPGS